MTPMTQPKQERNIKHKKPYHVILINDDDHSFYYVIKMLRKIFSYSEEHGFKLAKEVDETGRAIVCTCQFELAELRQDQIQSFGADHTISRCQGSMTAEIEEAA